MPEQNSDAHILSFPAGNQHDMPCVGREDFVGGVAGIILHDIETTVVQQFTHFLQRKEPVDLSLDRAAVGAVRPQIIDGVLDRGALRDEIDRCLGEPKDFPCSVANFSHPLRIVPAGHGGRMPEFHHEQSAPSKVAMHGANVCLIAALSDMADRVEQAEHGVERLRSDVERPMSCCSKRTFEPASRAFSLARTSMSSEMSLPVTS